MKPGAWALELTDNAMCCEHWSPIPELSAGLILLPRGYSIQCGRFAIDNSVLKISLLVR